MMLTTRWFINTCDASMDNKGRRLRLVPTPTVPHRGRAREEGAGGGGGRADGTHAAVGSEEEEDPEDLEEEEEGEEDEMTASMAGMAGRGEAEGRGLRATHGSDDAW